MIKERISLCFYQFYFYTPFDLCSISDYNSQLENMNTLEKDSSVDSQVAALQQAVALMQMGNMFETESKRNTDEKISNSSANIYQR